MFEHKLRFHILRHLDLACRSRDDILQTLAAFAKLWITHKTTCLKIHYKPGSRSLHTGPAFLVGQAEVSDKEKTVGALMPGGQHHIILPHRSVDKTDMHTGEDPRCVCGDEIVIAESQINGVLSCRFLSQVHKRRRLQAA